MGELERYTQARMGGNHPAKTTRKWVAARFEHDSSRPVDGYAAPQLHTHVVFFNITKTDTGQCRALQPQELYRSQQYATAVYRSELAVRLKALGYEVAKGESGQPEIKGYSKDYLQASSPRRAQIEDHMRAHGVRGAGAAQIAAHQTRRSKSAAMDHASMRAWHQTLATSFGNQPEHVRADARQRIVEQQQQDAACLAVRFARDRGFERQAVVDERDLMRDALKRSMGEANLREVRDEFEAARERGAFVERHEGVSRTFTTEETIQCERDTIERVRAGQDRHEALVSEQAREVVDEHHAHLSSTQRAAVEEVLSNRDQVMALEGVAGAGKTTSLSAIREAAEEEGYKVEGFAPTSRAAQKLEEAGIESTTLQKHLARGEHVEEGRHLYVIDESSLASSRQMNDFMQRLRDEDRVLLVGDTRQHQAIEAGQPYQQLQEAGMRTARLDEIVRQRDQMLKDVVGHLSRGEVHEAVGMLQRNGCVHQVVDRDERMKAIAGEYAAQPQGTLVISPDNASRREINHVIHRKMQDAGHVDQQEQKVGVLVARQDVTGADRRWAGQYEVGDVVRYAKGSEALGIEAGEYARVCQVDAKQNQLTVEKASGEQVSYDPRRLSGVGVHREAELTLARGDRVQFTAPCKDLRVANRELGTVESVEQSGDLRIKLDNGREVAFNARQHPHLDMGYAVTSHSSQGQTAERVMLHVDTEQMGENLVNNRMAYVAISRAQDEAQVFTDNSANLSKALARDVSREAAIETAVDRTAGAQVQDVASHAVSQGQGMDVGR